MRGVIGGAGGNLVAHTVIVSSGGKVVMTSGPFYRCIEVVAGL